MRCPNFQKQHAQVLYTDFPNNSKSQILKFEKHICSEAFPYFAYSEINKQAFQIFLYMYIHEIRDACCFDSFAEKLFRRLVSTLNMGWNVLLAFNLSNTIFRVDTFDFDTFERPQFFRTSHFSTVTLIGPHICRQKHFSIATLLNATFPISKKTC